MHLKSIMKKHILGVSLATLFRSIMILKDKMFINHTVHYIKEMCINAEWAIKMTIERYREIFEKELKNKLDDFYAAMNWGIWGPGYGMGGFY